VSDRIPGGPLMGWRLAEEVAWARPEDPGREWFTLFDIALNANDETRRGWPGRDYLAARAKKTPRTIDRYISALVKAGALVCVKPAGRGKRPVYEIPVLSAPATSCDTNDVPRKPVDNSASCDTNDVARSDSDRATQTMSHDPDTRTAFVRQNGSDRATQTMSHLSSVLPSVIHGVAVVGGPVEGDAAAPPAPIQLPSGPWLNGNGSKLPVPPPPASPRGRRETDAERRRQAAALNAWEKDHPEEAAGAAPA
jgi:hypothetical protein